MGTEFQRPENRFVDVLEQKRPLLRQNLDKLDKGDLTRIEQALLKSGIRSYIAVPLMEGPKPFGILSIGSHVPDKYSEEDSKFLLEVGQQVALSVKNTLAYEELSQLKVRLEHENRYLKEEIYTQPGFGDLVGGRSSTLRHVLTKVKLLAPYERYRAGPR